MVTSMKAKYGQLPISHLHNRLQKVEGEVDEFTDRIRELTFDKCSCKNGKSRGKLLPF